MTTFYPAPTGASASPARLEMLQRKPQRICATINWKLHQRLQDRADLEGRSLSNLICHLLELAE